MNYNHWTLTSTRDRIEGNVWRGVQQNDDTTGNGNSCMAEMNLEDFLAKAGAFGNGFSPSDPIAENGQWMQCQQLPSDMVQTPSHQRETPARKRVATGGDVGDRIVQRRQKRMLKNRESAARSRARKQAYTHELEIKVSLLEEENRKLREPKVEMLPSVVCSEQKKKLNRTSSAPF